MPPSDPDLPPPRASTSAADAMRPAGWGWLLVLACVLGLVRFHGLGAWGLWLDEAYTWADAHHGTGTYNPLGYAIVGGLACASC